MSDGNHAAPDRPGHQILPDPRVVTSTRYHDNHLPSPRQGRKTGAWLAFCHPRIPGPLSDRSFQTRRPSAGVVLTTGGMASTRRRQTWSKKHTGFRLAGLRQALKATELRRDCDRSLTVAVLTDCGPVWIFGFFDFWTFRFFVLAGTSQCRQNRPDLKRSSHCSTIKGKMSSVTPDFAGTAGPGRRERVSPSPCGDCCADCNGVARKSSSRLASARAASSCRRSGNTVRH